MLRTTNRNLLPSATRREKNVKFSKTYFSGTPAGTGLLPQRSAVASTHRGPAKNNRASIRQDFVEAGLEVGIRHIHAEPNGELCKTGDFGRLAKRFAVIHGAFPEEIQHTTLRG